MNCRDCGGKTRVYETRGISRSRECKMCGIRFKTKEVFERNVGEGDGLTVFERRQKHSRKECPVSRDEMVELMKNSTSLKSIATELEVSTTALYRWLGEFDL